MISLGSAKRGCCRRRKWDRGDPKNSADKQFFIFFTAPATVRMACAGAVAVLGPTGRPAGRMGGSAVFEMVGKANEQMGET